MAEAFAESLIEVILTVIAAQVSYYLRITRAIARAFCPTPHNQMFRLHYYVPAPILRPTRWPIPRSGRLALAPLTVTRALIPTQLPGRFAPAAFEIT